VAGAEIPEVFAFKGTATDIGVQRGPGQDGGIEYRIEGKFDYDGPLDLTRSTMTFHHFLDEYEDGGNGEMLLTTDNADLVCPEPLPIDSDCVATLPPLVSSSSSKRNEAKYETVRFRPQMRVQIKNKDGEFKFNVRLDRGTSPQVAPPGEPAVPPLLPSDRQFPKLCDSEDNSNHLKTNLRTAFTISDDVNANSVVIDFVKAWECSTPGRYHLRSR
jgi:hypothetical protein